MEMQLLQLQDECPQVGSGFRSLVVFREGEEHVCFYTPTMSGFRIHTSKFRSIATSAATPINYGWLLKKLKDNAEDMSRLGIPFDREMTGDLIFKVELILNPPKVEARVRTRERRPE